MFHLIGVNKKENHAVFYANAKYYDIAYATHSSGVVCRRGKSDCLPH
jgi:hypothetical protein